MHIANYLKYSKSGTYVYRASSTQLEHNTPLLYLLVTPDFNCHPNTNNIMSAAVANLPVRNDSKSSKKKKTKGDIAAKAPSAAPSTPTTETPPADTAESGLNGSASGKDFESPYVKELYKYVWTSLVSFVD